MLFHHHGTTLAGTLWLPTPRPRAALVMLTGSGPMDRDNNGYFPPIRDHFVRHGVAVLCFDKPGIGGSSGNWLAQSFHNRATEALAATTWLRHHPALATVKIGLWGHSQGGWIAPLAATLSDQVAFVISNSGPGVSVAEQDLYSLTQQLQSSGLPTHQIDQALAFARYLETEALDPSDNFVRVQNAVHVVQAQTWHAHIPQFDRQVWEFTKRIIGYDPRPILERVTCPLLAIFGECDMLVPLPKSVAIFEAAFRKAGNHEGTVVVFPGADHRIRIGNPPTFAPEYLETMTHWILQRVSGHLPA